MKVLGIIPARAGSKRIIGKNMKSLCGKPLTQYIIESAMTSKLLDSIVVSSDDSDILNLAAQFSHIIPLCRPDELANDTSPAIDYVIHTLEWMKKNKGQTFDIVVIIQPTSPLTATQDIDATIKLLLNEPSADSAVTVMRLNQVTHPFKLKTIHDKWLKPFLKEEKIILQAGELPDIYTRNGSVYVARMSNIEKGIIAGDKCLAHVMPEERSIDINEPIDLEFAEFLLKRNKVVDSQ